MYVESYPTDLSGRAVLFLEAPSLDSAAAFHPPSKHFVVVIAADTSGRPSAELLHAAGALIQLGASYVCCWGPDCERLHDCFDEADIAFNGDSSDDRVVMSTWHKNDSWEETLWFALNVAYPSAFYEAGTRAVVAVSVANADWAMRARTYLASGAPMRDET